MKPLWKVDTPELLNEIICNKEAKVLQIPLMIFRDLLIQVAQRSIEINDKELNKLMIRLALYENPHSRNTLDYLNT